MLDLFSSGKTGKTNLTKVPPLEAYPFPNKMISGSYELHGGKPQLSHCYER